MSPKKVAITSVFASFHTLLYFISFDLWRNWAIYLEPLEGIILGPWIGFLAAFIGSLVARAIKPIDFWMFGVFAEPLGVLAAGFLVRGIWKPVMAIYGIMLTAYFMHPLGQRFPLWTILDILLSLAIIYPTAKMKRIPNKGSFEISPISLILTSFVATATDALARVFLFIPMGLFSLLGLTTETVYPIFMAGAIASYIEDIQVIIVSFIVGIPVLKALKRVPGLI